LKNGAQHVGFLPQWHLSSAGLIGEKVVEREVFENSFQYNEARKTAIATYEAQLTEINSQLRNNNLSERERSNLRYS